MGKLTELPQALSFDEGDILVKDGTNGTKKIPVSEAAKYMGRDVIKINEEPTEGTKVVIETTDQDYELALMSDVDEVAGEVDEVKTQISGIENLEFSPIGFTLDGTGFIKWSTGDVSASASSQHTDYIDISAYKRIRYKSIGITGSSSTVGMAFYDSTKTYLNGVSAMPNQSVNGYAVNEVDVPNGAIYARFTTYTDTTTYGEFELYGENALISTIEAINNQLYGNFQDVAKSFTWGYIGYSATLNVIQPSSQGSQTNKVVWDKCNPGDIYLCTLTATSSRFPWFICDNTGAVISYGIAGTGADNKEITIPTNGAYFGANLYGANDFVKKKPVLPINNEEKAMKTYANKKLVFAHMFVGTSDPIDVSAPTTYSAAYNGGYLFEECKPGDIYRVSLKNIASSCKDVTIYDNTGNVLIASAIGIANKELNELTIIVPENGKYIAINSFYSDYSVQKLEDNADIIETTLNPFNGLKGVAFGTSLTARSDLSGYTGYLSYLRSMLLCDIDNQGIGGAYWFAPTGSSGLSISDKVIDYTDYSDKDFAIIEGCVNDWYGGRVLGTYNAAVDNASVCGHLHKMIDHIYAQNPNIQIYVILDHYGKNDGTIDCSSGSLRNSKTQYDFYTELEKLCEYYGIPVIKEYAQSNFGIYGEQYLVDNIHCNELGARQSAKYIVGEMKRYGIKLT